MKIGVTSLYSPRPIPHFITFLSNLLRKEGHEIHVLTCDAALHTCRSHLLRNLPKWVECLMCRAGGLRSFPLENYTAIQARIPLTLTREESDQLAYSSAITLSREETEEGFRGEVVRNYQEKLTEAVATTHANTVKWIRDKKLDAVFFYNGRMDITAAVLSACRTCGVSAVSVERSLVGHGMWLVPNASCLSNVEFDRMMETYSRVPLTCKQAELAGSFLSKRQMRKSHLEWRVYNPNAANEPWPVPGAGRKILVLPSSRNEMEGDPEWASEFGNMMTTLPRLYSEMSIKPEEVVIRAHPIWASKVGASRSSAAETVWREFAQTNNNHYIESAAKASSQHLMAQADLIIVNGSSAALEAGALGKPILCFGRSQYQRAGIALHIQHESDWNRLGELTTRDPAEIVRATLRYAYCVGWRFPQYVDHVRGVSSTQYVFLGGATATPLLDLIRTGRVPCADPDTANNTTEEDAVIAQCRAGRWADLVRPEAVPEKKLNTVHRRFLFRALDSLRKLLPHGDA